MMSRSFLQKLLVTLFSCLAASLYGTGQQAQGRVLDESGLPLQNAYIGNLRSGAHAHSGETGYFLITGTNPGDTLAVSHVSYQPAKRIVAADSSVLTIRLVTALFQLSDVVVRSNANHLNVISAIDTKVNPVNSSQELLRKVPGLFIGQHQGGGKAEQIFLRGFDIDHGTDIAISVDGMPVNMVSHAHGQGYADLHFLIPETVDKIDFDKGPYYSNKGNLATAGYVQFTTKERLDKSVVSVEAGRFNTLRTLAMFNLVNTSRQSAYVAAEYLNSDGYFQAPQNFYRFNLFGKYTANISDKDKVSVSVTRLASRWNASGQIPQRAVDAGLITRFGSIDSTEGGNTQRTNLQLQHLHSIDASTFVKSTMFYSRYAFELYSDFTFFLNDPVHGDQIRQKETRDLAGFESAVTKQLSAGHASVSWQTGVGLRYDAVGNSELSHTLNRKTTLDSIRLGDINENNAYAYTNAEIRLGNWMVNPGLRVDDFTFDYEDKLGAGFQRPVVRKAVISPKLNFTYSKQPDLQYFLKLGKGFHSNDTRVITAQTGNSILPAAWGADAGLTWKPFKNMVVNTALWYLYLQQEFIYAGDEGVVEPGGKTERKGFDAGLRWQWWKYFFFNGDFTYSFSRSLGEAKGSNYLPLAPKATFSGGLSYKGPTGFAGSIKTRYLGNRPANEDNSLVAKGYCITDLNLNWSCKQFTIGVITENIFNRQWNETQFATESRLFNEPQPVTEIHFTPGTPFNIRGTVTARF